VNELQQIIGTEIAATGPISFARFMELALYHETHGYYEKRSDQVGTSGDFITSVSVGDLFGRLLAFEFASWIRVLREGGHDPPFQIVEAGAHRGQLAHDILSEIQTMAEDVFTDVQCIIIEPSERRREWQRETLSEFEGRVLWREDWSELTRNNGPVNGIIYSNELLDAFPVHRYVWDAEAAAWFETGVAGNADTLVWTRLSGARESPIDPELCRHLPNGFIFESTPSAVEWWSQAASALGAGKLVAIDYGAEFEELVSPVRSNGTLRAYRNHSHVDSVLSDPGEQDLTATVNWSAIRTAGETAGLNSSNLAIQATFLTRILARAVDSSPENWQLTPKQIRQFQMLTHPSHLGQKFQTFIQSKTACAIEPVCAPTLP